MRAFHLMPTVVGDKRIAGAKAMPDFFTFPRLTFKLGGTACPVLTTSLPLEVHGDTQRNLRKLMTDFVIAADNAVPLTDAPTLRIREPPGIALLTRSAVLVLDAAWRACICENHGICPRVDSISRRRRRSAGSEDKGHHDDQIVHERTPWSERGVIARTLIPQNPHFCKSEGLL